MILISLSISLIALMAAVYAVFLQIKSNKQINEIQFRIIDTERRLIELQIESIRKISLIDKQVVRLREVTEELKKIEDKLEEVESNLSKWIVAMS